MKLLVNDDENYTVERVRFKRIKNFKYLGSNSGPYSNGHD